MKTFHNNSTNEKHTRIVCPYDSCEENLFTSVKLREHLCVKHNITVELEEITFDNLKGILYSHSDSLCVSCYDGFPIKSFHNL